MLILNPSRCKREGTKKIFSQILLFTKYIITFVVNYEYNYICEKLVKNTFRSLK